VDRAGLRRKRLKAQAEAGDIGLLFGDESEALTHPYLAHVWAKKGADLRIPAPGQSAKVAMLGVLDWRRRKLIVRTSRTKRSLDFIALFIALLEKIDRRFGPKLGRILKPIVLVLDNGPIHTSKATRTALAQRAHWLTVEGLPKYAPELNDIEGGWRDLKRHHLAHQTFTGPDDLDRAIQEAVIKLNTERNRHP
jgi:transposase